MTQHDFMLSIEEDSSPPDALSLPLRALWLEHRDQWEAAHGVINDIAGADGAWIHAYLHRVEGDLGNAAYWYHQAKKPTPEASVSLESEWLGLVAHFCSV